MFARGKLEQAVNSDAITVSMRAVTHNPDGSASVLVVTPDNKVAVRSIKADSALGDKELSSPKKVHRRAGFPTEIPPEEGHFAKAGQGFR